MASELSTFIQDELDKRGYKGDSNNNDNQFLVSEPQSSTAAVGIENKSRSNGAVNKPRRLRTYICGAFIVLVILVVWIILLATASGSEREQNNNSNNNDNQNAGQKLKSSIVPYLSETVVPADVPDLQPQPEAASVVFAPLIELKNDVEQEGSDEPKNISNISEGDQHPSSVSVFVDVPMTEKSTSLDIEPTVSSPVEESSTVVTPPPSPPPSSSPSVRVKTTHQRRTAQDRFASSINSDPRGAGGRKLLQNL